MVLPSSFSLNGEPLLIGNYVQVNRLRARNACSCALVASTICVFVTAPVQGDVVYTYWDGAAWVSQSVSPVKWANNTSLAVDNNDVPHIGYYVQVAFANDLRCATLDGTNWSTTIVDPMGAINPVGLSIMTDNDNRPHIGYVRHVGNIGELRYATFDGSQWQTEAADDSVFVFGGISMQLDSSNRPHVSYDSEEGLRYVTKEGGVWAWEGLGGGSETALALGADELPHILYSTRGGLLRYTQLNGLGSVWTGALGTGPSMAFDSMEKAHVSFQKHPSRPAHDAVMYMTNSSGQWEQAIVEEDMVTSTSIAVDHNDVPHIAYTVRVESALSYEVRYATLTESGWISELIAQTLPVTHVSLAIDSANRPRVVYATRVPEPTASTLWIVGVFGAFVVWGRCARRLGRHG